MVYVTLSLSITQYLVEKNHYITAQIDIIYICPRVQYTDNLMKDPLTNHPLQRGCVTNIIEKRYNHNEPNKANNPQPLTSSVTTAPPPRMGGKPKKKPALLDTTQDFAERTTIHGIYHIFDRSLSLVDRILWLVTVLGFLSLASYLSYSSYTEWREEQVITTLKDTTMPVTEVAFPTITICATGNHMNNVELAVQEDFRKWRNENNRTDDNTAKIQEDMDTYIKHTFQINDKNTNILDILDTMIASNVEAAIVANGVRENVIACSDENASSASSPRVKREISKKVKPIRRMVQRGKRSVENTAVCEDLLEGMDFKGDYATLDSISSIRECKQICYETDSCVGWSHDGTCYNMWSITGTFTAATFTAGYKCQGNIFTINKLIHCIAMF